MLPLVCLDVDGTLVGSSGAPSPRLWAAADRARGRGQHLTLCTARVAAGPTRRWAERLDPGGWHVFHTGAALWCPADGQLRLEPLAPDLVDACVAVAAERDWVLELYSWDDYVVDDDRPLAVDHAGLLGLPFERRPLDDLHDAVVRVQFVVPRDAAEAAIASAPPGTTASGATSPVMPDAAFVSLISEHASKAHAVATVAGELGVPLEQVMMVGDGHNDLPVMALVGHAVAMGDADPEVRAAATLVVAGVDDDGAAEAIDRSASLG
ncbi:MAG: HAD family hydrolase [Acidimicrobiia bacterium]